MSPMCPGSIWCQCESSVLTLKNDLSQQDLERRGCCVWQSPAPCWQPNRVAEEGIIRIVHTHTHVYKYTHQRANIHVRNTCIHSIRHEKLCARLPAQKKKKKESISWLIFSTSNRAWRCGRCHVALWLSESRLNATKTDRENRLYDMRHRSNTYP